MPAAFASMGAQAKSFPAKPMKLVVPATAGGPSDVLARVLAQGLSRELGQPMVVENVPGGGGSVAQARIAKSPGDGYTLFLGNIDQLAANPVFVSKLPYDTATATINCPQSYLCDLIQAKP